MAIFELASKQYKNGKREFVATLYELQPPECVVDDVGTKYNANGITFLEEYSKNALDSIKDMHVRVEFIDDERTMISGHGETGIINDMPVFENATTVGHFTEGYIDDVMVNGEIKRCVCGKGYLDEMCYPNFVATLEHSLKNKISVDGSIEIFKTKNNDAIIYKKGWMEKGRIPTEYIHSGWDMVMNPADTSSTLLELNNSKLKKEEELNMVDMKEISSVIRSTISELNSKEDSLNAQILELNSKLSEKDEIIVEKDSKISELNSSIEKMQETLDKLNKEHETFWAEREILEKEIAKAKIAEKLAELDKELSEFNEDEKEIVKDDIEKLKKNINACQKKDELNGVSTEINSIKSKICMDIVQKQKAEAEKQAKLSEQNSLSDNIEDIFSEMCEVDHKLDKDDDLNIF